jgi:hypothetical protein
MGHTGDLGDKVIALLREAMAAESTKCDRDELRLACLMVATALHLNDVGLSLDCHGSPEIATAMNNVGRNLSHQLARLQKREAKAEA